MTILYAILSGVVVFVLGRFIEKLFIDPIKEHRNVIAEIYDNMIFYANRISNPLLHTEKTSQISIDDYNKASDNIRRLSTKLRAATYNLHGVYGLYQIMFRAPSLKDISEVCGCLIGISNGLIYQDSRRELVDFNVEKREIIMQKLKLEKIHNKIG